MKRKRLANLVGKKVVTVRYEDEDCEMVMLVFDDGSTLILGSTTNGYGSNGMKFDFSDRRGIKDARATRG